MRHPTQKLPAGFASQGHLRLLHAEDFGDIDLCHAAVLKDGIDLQGSCALSSSCFCWGGQVNLDVAAAFGHARNLAVCLLGFVFRFIMPFSIIALGLREPLFNQIDVPRRHGNPFRGILLNACKR